MTWIQKCMHDQLIHIRSVHLALHSNFSNSQSDLFGNCVAVVAFFSTSSNFSSASVSHISRHNLCFLRIESNLACVCVFFSFRIDRVRFFMVSQILCTFFNHLWFHSHFRNFILVSYFDWKWWRWRTARNKNVEKLISTALTLMVLNFLLYLCITFMLYISLFDIKSIRDWKISRRFFSHHSSENLIISWYSL